MANDINPADILVVFNVPCGAIAFEIHNALVANGALPEEVADLLTLRVYKNPTTGKTHYIVDAA